MLRSTARVLLFMVVIALSKINAGAQLAPSETTGAVSPEDMKALLQRLQDLEGQVTALKSQVNRLIEKSATPPESAVNVSPAPEQGGIVQTMSMPGYGGENRGSPRLQLRGYADVGWNASDLKGATNSFVLGQFNLFITSRLTDKVSFLSETVIEADQRTNEFGVDLERLELIYAVSDHLNFQFGRFHTAIGYYNTAYHHSAFMQTALGRPFLFAFEDGGGILPVHSVGMSATGIVSSKLGLHYIAEIGNGRNPRTNVNPVQNVGDDNNGKAFNLGFFVRPASMPGLEFGFSNYHDHVTPPGNANVTENVLAAHVIYQNSRFEFLNEAVLLRHSTQGSSIVANTPGFYSQVSRSFGGYRPYFRYEYLNVPGGDPLYSDVGLLHGPKVGLRYELNDFTAFKVEYGRTMRRGLGPVNRWDTTGIRVLKDDMRKTMYILAFAVMLACSVGNTQASHGDGESGDIAVVVNASNPVNELTLSELRNMLTGDRRFWKGNVRVKLILREPGTRERDAVLSGLLKLDNKAFVALWRARVFRGEASDEPLSVHSAAQVEQYMLENPGGITFMVTKAPAPQLKVIRLEGKLPGEHGYAFK